MFVPTKTSDLTKGRIVVLSPLAAANALFIACAGQAHSPAAAGEQYAMHWCVGTLQWAAKKCPHPWGSGSSSNFVVTWAHMSLPPEGHLDRI